MDRDFLGDIFSFLQSIQAYPKGKIKDYDNVYLPRLSVKRVDTIAERVRCFLTDRPHSNVVASDFNYIPTCQHGLTQKCPECAADKAWG